MKKVKASLTRCLGFYIFDRKGDGYEMIARWLMTKKKEERELKNLKESLAIFDKAIYSMNVDMAFVSMVAALNASRKLGFKSIEEARKHYILKGEKI